MRRWPLSRLRSTSSLRWQLTVWLGLSLGLVLALFTVAIYGLLSRNLYGQVDASLSGRAAQVERVVRWDPRFGERPLEIELPNTFASADVFVQVLTLEGEVLGRSENLKDSNLPVPAEVLDALRAGEGKYAEATVGGQHLRIYSAPLTLPESPISAIQVARSLEPIEAALTQLRLLAGIGLLLALALAGLIVWYLSGKALRPLEHVIETSEAIRISGDLQRRVRPTHSGDEVGRLATTFNQMLAHLEASDSELRQAYRRLEASLQAQRRFTADASHELRTPLTTIRGYAGLLRQFAQVTPEDRIAAVAQIDLQAARMSRLVEDLLTLARADSGQHLSREPVELTSLLQDVVAQARTLAPAHTIDFSVSEPVEVCGSPDALHQLLLILIDNAVKYTSPGGHIHIELETTQREARIMVSDTGIGISPRDLEHIFERFYRAHRERGEIKGTGLGLSIARWIVEEHDGAIEVASQPGSGSTFSVRLPLLTRSLRAGDDLPSQSPPETLTVP